MPNFVSSTACSILYICLHLSQKIVRTNRFRRAGRIQCLNLQTSVPKKHPCVQRYSEDSPQFGRILLLFFLDSKNSATYTAKLFHIMHPTPHCIIVNTKTYLISAHPQLLPHLHLPSCLQSCEPALLVGETGTGKTTVCQLAARARQQPLLVVSCNQHTEAADFIGSFRPARDRATAVSTFCEAVRNAGCIAG